MTERYFYLIAMGCYLARIIVVGASFGDSIIFSGLCALLSFLKHIESHAESPINNEYKTRLVYVEDQLKITKDKVGAMQLGASFKR